MSIWERFDSGEMQSDNDTETSNLGTKQFNKRAEHFGKNTMTGDIDTKSVYIATE